MRMEIAKSHREHQVFDYFSWKTLTALTVTFSNHIHFLEEK